MNWKTSLITPEPLQRAEARMRRALDVAKCTPAGDVPVGAVLFDATGAELASNAPIPLPTPR